METSILYEDATMIVVEKPAGIPSCPRSPKQKDPNTVEGWLQKRFPEAKLVHRLDNDTSGLLVGAKDEATFQRLRKIWNTPQVVKKYLAVVQGKTPPEGKIGTPIAHHPRKKKKMKIGGKKPRPAATFFKTLKHFKETSLVEVKIETGVRHQIRIHLASIGHPIVGDPIYNKKQEEPDSRLLLHLGEISLQGLIFSSSNNKVFALPFRI